MLVEDRAVGDVKFQFSGKMGMETAPSGLADPLECEVFFSFFAKKNGKLKIDQN